MRLGLAFRAFFAALFDKKMAAPMEQLLAGPEAGLAREPGAAEGGGCCERDWACAGRGNFPGRSKAGTSKAGATIAITRPRRRAAGHAAT